MVMAVISVFPVSGEYLFKHYFDHGDVFEKLQEYYEEDEYRFAVPEDEFEEVKENMADWGHDLIVLDDIEEYIVVKEQYTKHADILRNSVAHWTRREHNFFLLKSETAVYEAVEQKGATPVSETEFEPGI